MSIKITEDNFKTNKEIRKQLQAKYIKVMDKNMYQKIYHLFIVHTRFHNLIDIFHENIKSPFFTYDDTMFFKVNDKYMKNSGIEIDNEFYTFAIRMKSYNYQGYKGFFVDKITKA